jgi:hypothetical protein
MATLYSMRALSSGQMQLTNLKDHSLRTKEGLEAQLANAKYITASSQICIDHNTAYRGGDLKQAAYSL